MLQRALAGSPWPDLPFNPEQPWSGLCAFEDLFPLLVRGVLVDGESPSICPSTRDGSSQVANGSHMGGQHPVYLVKRPAPLEGYRHRPPDRAVRSRLSLPRPAAPAVSRGTVWEILFRFSSSSGTILTFESGHHRGLTLATALPNTPSLAGPRAVRVSR
jgi:hypothetical protein